MSTFLMNYAIPVFSDVLKAAIGVLLILMPRRVISWVEKLQKKLECRMTKPEGPDEEVGD